MVDLNPLPPKKGRVALSVGDGRIDGVVKLFTLGGKKEKKKKGDSRCFVFCSFFILFQVGLVGG